MNNPGLGSGNRCGWGSLASKHTFTGPWIWSFLLSMILTCIFMASHLRGHVFVAWCIIIASQPAWPVGVNLIATQQLHRSHTRCPPTCMCISLPLQQPIEVLLWFFVITVSLVLFIVPLSLAWTSWTSRSSQLWALSTLRRCQRHTECLIHKSPCVLRHRVCLLSSQMRGPCWKIIQTAFTYCLHASKALAMSNAAAGFTANVSSAALMVKLWMLLSF